MPPVGETTAAEEPELAPLNDGSDEGDDSTLVFIIIAFVVLGVIILIVILVAACYWCGKPASSADGKKLDDDERYDVIQHDYNDGTMPDSTIQSGSASHVGALHNPSYQPDYESSTLGKPGEQMSVNDSGLDDDHSGRAHSPDLARDDVAIEVYDEPTDVNRYTAMRTPEAHAHSALSDPDEGDATINDDVDADADTDAVNADTVDAVLVDVDAVDADAVNADAVNADAVDADAVNADAVDADAVDANAIDADAIVDVSDQNADLGPAQDVDEPAGDVNTDGNDANHDDDVNSDHVVFMIDSNDNDVDASVPDNAIPAPPPPPPIPQF